MRHKHTRHSLLPACLHPTTHPHAHSPRFLSLSLPRSVLMRNS
jgi:hypothetical protein